MTPAQLRAIHASNNRKFNVGDNVYWITSHHPNGSYFSKNYLASGVVTEINNPFVTAKIDDQGRKKTGQLGMTGMVKSFIKVTESNKHDLFSSVCKGTIINKTELNRN